MRDSKSMRVNDRKEAGARLKKEASDIDHGEKRKEDTNEGVRRDRGLNGGTITERISEEEMKDSHYLLLIKEKIRDRDRGRESERGGRGGG